MLYSRAFDKGSHHQSIVRATPLPLSSSQNGHLPQLLHEIVIFWQLEEGRERGEEVLLPPLRRLLKTASGGGGGADLSRPNAGVTL